MTTLSGIPGVRRPAGQQTEDLRSGLMAAVNLSH
jgi:hypothetical protein